MFVEASGRRHLLQASGAALAASRLRAASAEVRTGFIGIGARGTANGIGDGSLQAILISAILVFVSLIPFFAFVELERVLGAQDLHTLLWGRRRPKGASGEHVERHFLNTETVRDVVIGMADGLTMMG